MTRARSGTDNLATVSSARCSSSWIAGSANGTTSSGAHGVQSILDARDDYLQGPGVVQALSITRPSGRAKLGVLIRAIPLGQWSESRQRPGTVVFLRDPESSGAQPSQELVRRLFGLTRMEAQLALLLTEGLTLDEADEQMNVRRNTARTHLRSIFSKTGVTRQTMLVRLLLNSVISLG